MNSKPQILLGVLAIIGTIHTSHAQSTAWTFQGFLTDQGSPTTGLFDLGFGLYAVETNGTPLATTTRTDVTVTDGLFTVTLDFGPGLFDGTDYFLEIGVLPAGTQPPFEVLSPRHPITPTPYAIKAIDAMVVALGAIYNPSFLGTTNSDALVLSANNAVGLRLEAYTTGSVNLIGGYAGNQIGDSSPGSIIAGGGNSPDTNSIGQSSPVSTISGGSGNTIGNNVQGATVAGGQNNVAGSIQATVSGGGNNQATGSYATVPGGSFNEASGRYSQASGRRAKAVHEGAFVWADSINGNFSSQTNDQFAVRANGGVRLATGGTGASLDGKMLIRNPSGNGAVIISSSTSGEGVDPELVIQSSETGAGSNAPFHISRNAIFQTSTDSYQYIDDIGEEAAKLEFVNNGDLKFSSATNGTGRVFFQDNLMIKRTGRVGIGQLNPGAKLDISGNIRINDGTAATGYVLTSTDTAGLAEWQPMDAQAWTTDGNDAYRLDGNVGIGVNDPNSKLDVNGTTRASRFHGGNNTVLSGNNGFMGGGNLNTNTANNGGLVSGERNRIEGARGFIGGGRFNVIETGTDNVIGGGQQNIIIQNGGSRGINAVIAGGRTNICSQTFGVIGGGRLNVLTNNNVSSILFSTIGGGDGNYSAACSGTIAGGWNNTNVAGFAPTVGGGRRNVADGNYTTIAGGRGNQATASHATIPGGRDNIASGNYSFAAGRRAKAINEGAFVWADNSDSDLESTQDNQFLARASGGFVLRTADNGVSGAQLPSGGSFWLGLSDRNSKKAVEPLDTREVLEKLSAIPMNTWQYKAQEGNIRHAGPMAQDFHAAFGLGESERHLNAGDVDGIALAAIQGLNQKLNEKEATIKALQESLANLTKRLEAIENATSSTSDDR